MASTTVYAPVGADSSSPSHQRCKRDAGAAGSPAVAWALAGALMVVLALLLLSGSSGASRHKLWAPIRVNAGGDTADRAWLPPSWVGEPPPLDPLACKPQLVVAGVPRSGSLALSEHLNGTAPVTIEEADSKPMRFLLNGTRADPAFLRRYADLPLERRKLHPALLGSHETEPHIFDSPGANMRHALVKTFPGMDPGDDPLAGRCSLPTQLRLKRGDRPAGVRFEATSSYFGDDLAVEQMKRYIPEARFVLLLREPISRAISHLNLLLHKHNLDKGKAPDRFDVTHLFQDSLLTTISGCLKREADELQACHDAFKEHTTKPWNQQVLECLRDGRNHWNDQNTEGMLAKGLYDLHLPSWFGHFSPQQTLVWSSLAFQRAPREHAMQLVRWLGLDPAEVNHEVEWMRLHEVDAPPAGRFDPELMRRLERLVAPHMNVALAMLRQWGHGEAATQLERAWAEERRQTWDRYVRLEPVGGDSWGGA